MNCGVVWATDVNPALGKLQNRLIVRTCPGPFLVLIGSWPVIRFRGGDFETGRCDVPTDRATAAITRVPYRPDFIKRLGEAARLPAITIEATDLPKDVLLDHHFLNAGARSLARTAILERFGCDC
jgi:hypothetical protein